MKGFLTTFSAFLAVTMASPIMRRAGVSDVANDMEDLFNGKGECADVGVIFARGTFDSGNIGVWVGPQFKAALAKSLPGKTIAFQGVSATDYKATLLGYLGEAGSPAGGKSLAETLDFYNQACPDTQLIVSGWSQGALVAHRGVAGLAKETLAQVKGLVTFGDPSGLFAKELPPVPKGVKVNSQCFVGSVPDPLCAGLGDLKLPRTPGEVVAPFTALPGLAVGAQESAAAAKLVAAFPGQLVTAAAAFAKTIATAPQRALLTPQHFMYGNKGLTDKAALFVASVIKA
ncbi:Carbohydrate esterase family 5 protein [Mycena indigotica]|uniref:cutinase n=1 Tax=Mycena indigotica TaxID=2126181 RepID=A0A8H6S522_9AGAR|nr:Carbohydrate esterase family 5 protein [Mycena indigotica]KAF7292196.1 Carbohydrate esterase family 5 protein [Mycena indigotica]